MRGTIKRISPARRLIIDLMRASRNVPFASLQRTVDLRKVQAARRLVERPPGWASIFTKAFCLVAREQPRFRTLYIRWPWPHFYELDSSVAMIAVARRDASEEFTLPQKIRAPEDGPLRWIDALIKSAKNLPIEAVTSFRRVLGPMKYPLPVRRALWAFLLNYGRQRGSRIGNVAISSVSAFGPGELRTLTPGPFILTYGAIRADKSVEVILAWDHRVLDGAAVVAFFERLQEILDAEIVAEITEPLAMEQAASQTVATA